MRASTKQLAISSSGSNSHAETPFSWMAKNWDSEMSVCIVSGGLACIKAGQERESQQTKNNAQILLLHVLRTLGFQILESLVIIHAL